jgi:hypothetical protein
MDAIRSLHKMPECCPFLEAEFIPPNRYLFWLGFIDIFDGNGSAECRAKDIRGNFITLRHQEK